MNVHVIGAGPAGCSAALAALHAGANVELFDPAARQPRHKVCGEFMGPELWAELDQLGIAELVRAAQPASIHQVELKAGRVVQQWTLQEPAVGLSRRTLDRILFDAALAAGAKWKPERGTPGETPTVLACGRHSRSARKERLFGFKAHFDAAPSDFLRLIFFDGGYAGVSPVEGGRVNVCGVATETLLKQHNWDGLELLHHHARGVDFLQSRARSTDWLITGPLTPEAPAKASGRKALYLAGDYRRFIDPFTGTGIISALGSGRVAGLAAARAIPPERVEAQLAKTTRKQYVWAGLLRKSIQAGIAEAGLRLISGNWLFQLTRPGAF